MGQQCPRMDSDLRNLHRNSHFLFKSVFLHTSLSWTSRLFFSDRMLSERNRDVTMKMSKFMKKDSTLYTVFLKSKIGTKYAKYYHTMGRVVFSGSKTAAPPGPWPQAISGITKHVPGFRQGTKFILHTSGPQGKSWSGLALNSSLFVFIFKNKFIKS